ncbi:MAG: adenylate/guanylate cyclase domain-containing protein [Opitutaceae bacterium]|jgi:class 3 adenylate cyclase
MSPTEHSAGKNRFIPLRVSMAMAFALTAIITALLVGYAVFFTTRSYLLNGIRQRMIDVVTLTADRIDPAAHATLRTRKDEASATYARIKQDLLDVRSLCPDIRYAYTYRIDAAGRTTFVVDSDPADSSDFSHIGDVYDDPTDEMRFVYRIGAGAVAEKNFATDEWGTWLSCFIPVRNAAGEVECGLGLDMSAQLVKAHERAFRTSIIGTSLAIGVLMSAMGIFYARRISRPLLSLADELGRVERLQLDHHIEIRSWVREVIVMRDAVRNLKTGLRSFRKYVPADLVSELLALGQEARLSAEKREVTVFFSDIADFTTISEKTPPEQLVKNLSHYFDGMTRSIIDHNGTVDKYIGDCVMAFWGAPRPLEDHAVLACRAALRCHDHSQRVAAAQHAAGALPMFTRIGLNTGPAIIGNIGYDARLNYTAMGDMVNLASRLEGLNKYYGTRILISEFTWRQAREAMEARLIDLVAVKGRREPIRIYELIAEHGQLTPAQTALVAGYEHAFGLYLERNFAAAADAFTRVLTGHPEDGPATVMLKRCRLYLTEPPADGWQGEFIATSK